MLEFVPLIMVLSLTHKKIVLGLILGLIGATYGIIKYVTTFKGVITIVLSVLYVYAVNNFDSIKHFIS